VFREFRESFPDNTYDANHLPQNGGRTQFADRLLQDGLTRMFEADNPRFDRDRFIAACEVPRTTKEVVR
jgi:hypothetical protein